MNINDLYKVNGKYISLIPGIELSECLKLLIAYCKENNTSTQLEFNGVVNRVESWVDPNELSKIWYSEVPDKWYDEQRIKSRDSKVDQIID